MKPSKLKLFSEVLLTFRSLFEVTIDALLLPTPWDSVAPWDAVTTLDALTSWASVAALDEENEPLEVDTDPRLRVGGLPASIAVDCELLEPCSLLQTSSN